MVGQDTYSPRLSAVTIASLLLLSGLLVGGPAGARVAPALEDIVPTAVLDSEVFGTDHTKLAADDGQVLSASPSLLDDPFVRVALEDVPVNGDPALLGAYLLLNQAISGTGTDHSWRVQLHHGTTTAAFVDVSFPAADVSDGDLLVPIYENNQGTPLNAAQINALEATITPIRGTPGSSPVFAIDQVIIILDRDDKPAFQASPLVQLGEGQTIQVDLEQFVIDDDGQTRTYTIESNPAHGTLTPVAGQPTKYVYTPAAGYTGSDAFTVRANDGLSTSDATVVGITVVDINVAPSFTKGPNVAVNEDSGLQTITGWATAISPGPTAEAGQALTFTLAHGNSGLFAIQPALSPAGVLTFTPAANANGVATVSVTLADNGGTAFGGDDTSDPQEFTITVNAVNDAPTLPAFAAFTVPEDGVASVTLPAAIDVDTPSSGLTYTISTPATKGTAALASATRLLTYTASTAHYNGPDSLVVQVSDGSLVATRELAITVSPVADAIVADAGADQTVPIGALVTLDGSGSKDVDATGTAQTTGLTYAWAVTSTSATVDLTATSATAKFTAPTTFTGNDLAIKVQLTASKSGKSSGTDDVTITVTKRPVIAALSTTATTLNEDTVKHLNFTIANGLTVSTWAVNTPPTKGALAQVSGGHWKYTPNANANGVDTFKMQATATLGSQTVTSDATTVTLTITPVNDAPTVSAGTDKVATASSVVQLVATGSDPDSTASTALTYQWTRVSSAGTAITLSDATQATASFTAPALTPGQHEVHTFRVTVSDGVTSASDDVQVTIHNDDEDLDGVAGAVDNCPKVANADQADQDGDKAGDLCDASNVKLPTRDELLEQIKDIQVTVVRRGDANVVSWKLPPGIDPIGVQVFRGNSPYVLVATLTKSDAGFTAREYTDEGAQALSTSRYLVTPFYSLTGAGGYVAPEDAATNVTLNGFTGFTPQPPSDVMRVLALVGGMLMTVLGAVLFALVLRGTSTGRKAGAGAAFGAQVLSLGWLAYALGFFGSADAGLSRTAWTIIVLSLHVAALVLSFVLLRMPARDAPAAAPAPADEAWESEFSA